MIGRSRPSHSLTHQPHSAGFILVLTIAISFVLSLLTVSLLSVAAAKYSKTKADINDTAVVYAAEAGISDTVDQLNKTNGSFTGYSTEKQFYSNTRQGKATYTTTVVNNGNDTLTLTSTGFLYRTGADTTSFMQKKLRVLIFITKVPAEENIIAGSGGIGIYNTFGPPGLTTALTGGSVYTRGKVRTEGGGAWIGTPTNSMNLTVANIECGASGTWPQPCPSSDPSITIKTNVFQPGNPAIYGTVCANDQPPSSFIFPGPTGRGLIDGCRAPDVGLPKFDKKAFTDKQTVTTSLNNLCVGWGGANHTWPANARINGSPNVISMSGPCVITLEGDVYIKGNLNIDSNAKFVVANSVGTRRVKMVVNGSITISGHAIGFFPNSAGAGIDLISFDSSNSSCSNSDTANDCLTPTQQYDSFREDYYGRGIGFWGSSLNNPVDFSSITAYAYYAGINYRMDKPHSIRAVGGQFISLYNFHVNGEDNNLTATDNSAPFGSMMYYTKYKIGDYLPVYN